MIVFLAVYYQCIALHLAAFQADLFKTYLQAYIPPKILIINLFKQYLEQNYCVLFFFSGKKCTYVLIYKIPEFLD